MLYLLIIFVKKKITPMSGIPKIKYPITYQELLEFGTESMPFAGTWNDFLTLLPQVDYTIEFHENIIYAMSFASAPHEAIVKNVLVALSILLDEDPAIHIRPSNRHIYIKKHQKQYAPDVHVVKGAIQFHQLTKNMNVNTNPWLVVEVLSPSTENKDWSKKLPFYKKIPSLKHILYIEQNRPFVSVFNRKGKSSKWENIDYDDLNDFIALDKKLKISMRKIYKKVLLKNT